MKKYSGSAVGKRRKAPTRQAVEGSRENQYKKEKGDLNLPKINQLCIKMKFH